MLFPWFSSESMLKPLWPLHTPLGSQDWRILHPKTPPLSESSSCLAPWLSEGLSNKTSVFVDKKESSINLQNLLGKHPVRSPLRKSCFQRCLHHIFHCILCLSLWLHSPPSIYLAQTHLLEDHPTLLQWIQQSYRQILALGGRQGMLLFWRWWVCRGSIWRSHSHPFDFM